MRGTRIVVSEGASRRRSRRNDSDVEDRDKSRQRVSLAFQKLRPINPRQIRDGHADNVAAMSPGYFVR